MSLQKQIARRPISPGSDISKENFEDDEEARSLTTEDLGVVEIDIRDLSRPVEAHNLLQYGIAESPGSFPASVRLDLGSRLAPSPYIPIHRPSADDTSNAFASRFAAVPVSLEPSSTPFHFLKWATRCLADLYCP